jgi:hypothetical protein
MISAGYFKPTYFQNLLLVLSFLQFGCKVDLLSGNNRKTLSKSIQPTISSCTCWRRAASFSFAALTSFSKLASSWLAFLSSAACCVRISISSTVCQCRRWLQISLSPRQHTIVPFGLHQPAPSPIKQHGSVICVWAILSSTHQIPYPARSTGRSQEVPLSWLGPSQVCPSVWKQ